MSQLPGTFLLSISLVGASIGLVVGLIALRLSLHCPGEPLGFWGLLVDAALGAAGFVGGVLAAMLTPMASRTTTQNVGGVIIRETTRRFAHPYWVGVALAFLLAIVFEVVRARRSKKAAAP